MKSKVAARAVNTARCAGVSLFPLESTQLTQLHVTLALQSFLLFPEGKKKVALPKPAPGAWCQDTSSENSWHRAHPSLPHHLLPCWETEVYFYFWNYFLVSRSATGMRRQTGHSSGCLLSFSSSAGNKAVPNDLCEPHSFFNTPHLIIWQLEKS